MSALSAVRGRHPGVWLVVSVSVIVLLASTPPLTNAMILPTSSGTTGTDVAPCETCSRCERRRCHVTDMCRWNTADKEDGGGGWCAKRLRPVPPGSVIRYGIAVTPERARKIDEQTRLAETARRKKLGFMGRMMEDRKRAKRQREREARLRKLEEREKQ